MRVGILGAAEARLDGVAVDLGTRKQRALLAALALHRGRPVAPDALVDLLWGDAPPAAVTATLQGYVARLRRALEPDRPPRAPSEVLVTQQAGYALQLADGRPRRRRASRQRSVRRAPALGHRARCHRPSLAEELECAARRARRGPGPAGAARRTPSSRTRRPPRPSAPGSRSCA